MLFAFYAKRIQNVSSVHELNRLIRDCGGPEFLCATEADLTDGQALSFDAAAFPDAVPLGGQPVALTYAYTPGEEQDGVTVKLGFSLAQTISQASVEWAIPGLREGLINELLRALPKSIRRELMPFPPKVEEILREFKPGGDSLPHDLAVFIRQKYGVAIPPNTWASDAVPAHLRPRIEVIGHDQKSLGTSRDLGALRQTLEATKVKPVPDDSAWQRVAQQWEQFGLSAWSFGDLPAQITVSENGPVPIYAWPGLSPEENGVSLKLFRSVDLSRLSTLAGIQQLVEAALSKDFAWLQKDLRALTRFQALAATLCSMDELQESALKNLKGHVLPAEVFAPLTERNFLAAVETSRQKIPGLAAQLIDCVGRILKLRQEIQTRGGPAPAPPPTKSQKISNFSELNLATKDVARPKNVWAEELDALLPRNFLEIIPFTQLAHLPRYLKALATRMERAKLNPVKDQERAGQLAPYLAALKKLEANPPAAAAARQRLAEFRWLVEEFKVSLFAQELGTSVPVSPQRLAQHWQALG
jgi:ATP-dependent helicase HrpA